MTEHPLPPVTDRDVYITRTFDAPIGVVWRFWTDPDLLAQWFGPAGITTPRKTVTVDPVPGGAWNLEMTDDAGVYPLSATIVEIIENEYLELVMSAEAGVGHIENVYVRIRFHDHGDTTRMTLHQGPFTPEHRDMTTAGWLESFDKIDAILTRNAPMGDAR